MERTCEKCGGAMWNNTVNKKNPKGPDYKCKDVSCGHAVWLNPKPKPSPPATVEDMRAKFLIEAYKKNTGRNDIETDLQILLDIYARKPIKTETEEFSEDSF